MDRRPAIFSIVCFAFFVLPLGIVNIVMSTHLGECDHEDEMGLDVKQYLLGLGISSVIVSIIAILLLLITLCVDFKFGILYTLVIVTNILFGFCWFIIGSIILFRGNIECIEKASVHVIYALVLWCISALDIVKNYFCCNVLV